MNRPLALLCCCCLHGLALLAVGRAVGQPAIDADFSTVPGVVVAYSPASSGLYIGSPSIAILPDGDYLASHDEFGPKSTEHQQAVTRVYRSADRGATWSPVARVEGQFWSTLFTHREAVYLIGTWKHHGNVVIRRSTDGGRTWTEPDSPQHGLLAEGEYHCAPQPVIEHNGRLWRAMEDAGGGTMWGERYRPLMMSVAVDADLLDRQSWTFSNHVTLDNRWLDGQLRGWLEGNAVVNPDGEVVNLLRVAGTEQVVGKAAMLQVSANGRRIEFDPATGFIDFPGGCKKFTIRHDPKSNRYWSLVNWVKPEDVGKRTAGSIRNTLAVTRSTDLHAWQISQVVIEDRDLGHGYQYPDWLFDGDDLVAVVRTATDDGLGGPRNYHDANFLTFHRIENFRTRSEEAISD